MATTYPSNSITNLTASKNEHQQVQAYIRALHQRADVLYGKLSRSPFASRTAFCDLEKAYISIFNEFHEQRDQLKKYSRYIEQNISQSTSRTNGMHRHMYSKQSSLRHAPNIEVHEINPIVADLEHVLIQIEQQLKQYRFKSSHADAMIERTLGKQHGGKLTKKTSMGSVNNIAIHRLYAIDIDMIAEWVVASVDGRIFFCNSEGETRIFSYSRRFHRQPLLTERFYLSTVRLISSFSVTQDYLIAYETDTRMITLHTHHGALLIRSNFFYDPNMIIRCDYLTKNQFWSCSRTKRRCCQFNIDHSTNEIHPIRQLDYKHPITNILIDPIDISSDEQQRLAIHDVNMITTDRLLIYSNNDYQIIPLDFIKYTNQQGSSRIERVLLVPKQPHLIVIIRVPHSTTAVNLHEIVIVDIELQPPKIVSCLTEPNGIQNIDFTLNGELVYTIKPLVNKRTTSKMFIYSLIN